MRLVRAVVREACQLQGSFHLTPKVLRPRLPLRHQLRRKNCCDVAVKEHDDCMKLPARKPVICCSSKPVVSCSSKPVVSCSSKPVVSCSSKPVVPYVRNSICRSCSSKPVASYLNPKPRGPLQVLPDILKSQCRDTCTVQSHHREYF